MNFQVPQFIETEDQIIGPLTLREFLYLAFGGGLIFLLFFFLNFIPWIILSFLIGSVAAVFAFLKINGRPLAIAFLAAVNFYWKPRFYLWQKENMVVKTSAIEMKESKISQVKSSLDNLWDQLKTTKQPIPKREKKIEPSILDRTKSSKERFEMMRKITGEREMARRVDYR